MYVLPLPADSMPLIAILTSLCLVGTAALNVTNRFCGIEPAHDESWIAPAIALLCLMVIVVSMRILARAIAGMSFWWDDWMNFAAMVGTPLIRGHTLWSIS